MTPITYDKTDKERWWAEWSAAHVVPVCGVDGCSLPADTCTRHEKPASPPRREYKTLPTRFIIQDHAHYKSLVEQLGPTTPPRTRKALIAACPPELIGTAHDPVFANGQPVASSSASVCSRSGSSPSRSAEDAPSPRLG
jgi:hypothetical protein